MSPSRPPQWVNVLSSALAFGHALLTWSAAATVALFVGGVGVAFASEAVVVRAGLLRHRFHPQVAGVPLSVLLAWPAVVYSALRLALLVVDGAPWAPALAAALATAVDAVTDPVMTARGAWAYPPSRVSRPRFRGVPWWNFAGWLVVVFVTASLPGLVT